MITPDKMSQLSSNDEINKMYAELNNELTKEIVNSIKEYENLILHSQIDIKKVINIEKRRILKESLKKTRKLHRKTKKAIKSVYKEMSDALNDDRRNNRESRKGK